MGFRTLPPGLAELLIEGIEDTLTPEVEQRQTTISSSPCPRCHGAMHQHFHPVFAFSPGDPLPRTVARCVDCGYTYDPLTNLVIDTGNPADIEEALPLIRGDDN